MTLLRRKLVLSALMLAALAATYAAGNDRSLDTAVPERFRYYGIPIAVSADRYGLPGYVAYSEIAARFFNDKSVDVILSQDLPKSLEGRTIDEGRRGAGLFFVPADDKGDVTFTRIAFRLFGPQVRSLYLTYFTLLLLSLTAFILAFWTEPARLFVGLCVMLASLALVSAYQNDLLLPNVVTFYDPRIFGVMAVLAVLHLGFSCVDGQRLSPVRLVGAAYQAAIVVLAVHVRSDNAALVAALATWVGADVLWKHGTQLRWRFLRRVWPLAVLAAAFGGLLGWERLAYHPRYYSTHMAHHLIWHNVGISLAMHPEFAKDFDFPPAAARRVDQEGDVTIMKRVVRSLLESGRADTVEKIFGAAYSNPSGDSNGIAIDVGKFFHSDGSDLALYDGEVKRFILASSSSHPLATAQLFARYKPRYIVAHYLWFMGLTTSRPTIDAAGYPSPLFSGSGGAARAGGAFVPISWLGIAILGLALLVSQPGPPRKLHTALAACAVLLVFSLAPMMVTYAAPFLMGTPLLALSLALHLSVVTMALVVAGARLQGFDQTVRAKAVDAAGAGLAFLRMRARSLARQGRPYVLDAALALTLALITLAGVAYFVPRGFNSGFVDMAHDGYQLRQALDLAAGKTIFRETFEQYGPLTPYLNLIGFMAFGQRLLAIKYFVALWYALTTVVMFVLARQFLSRALSVFTIVVWLAVAPFYQHGVMVSPHAYALLVQAVALILVLRQPGTGTRHLWIAGMLCGACWLLKQTLGVLFLWSILSFFLAIWLFEPDSRRRTVTSALRIAAGFLIVVLAALAWLFSRGAIHDWYLQTIAFPNAFYLGRNAGGKSGLASGLNLAMLFAGLQWKAGAFWLILRGVVLTAGAVALARPGPRDWKLILAGFVTLLLWLAAFPSANYMHQWWTISLTICAAVYTLKIVVSYLLQRFGRRPRFVADAVTMAIVVLLAWPLAMARWSGALARSAALSETLQEPWSVSGIRMDPATRQSFTHLYEVMAEYRSSHPGTQIVSIDKADGDTQGIAETLPLLSFFHDNPHSFPIYWNLPILSSSIYPDYPRALRAFLRQTKPLVLDYLIAGWPEGFPPEDYRQLATAPTREGRLIVYAPNTSPVKPEVLAFQPIPDLRDIVDQETGQVRRASVYVWPRDVQLPEMLAYQAVELSSVVAQSPMVLGDRGIWLVDGAAETADSYLLQFKPRQVSKDSWFIATGVLEEGGFTLGFLKAGVWAASLNVTKPGWFAVALQVPEDGEYELILANLVSAPKDTVAGAALRRLGLGATLPAPVLQNRFRIQASGWAPPA